MSARNWLNLGLLALVAVSLVLVLLEPGRGPAPERRPLLALAPEQISRIEVLRPERDEVVLERRDGQWFVAQPLALAANTGLVEQLLRIAADTCPRRYAGADLDLSELRLAPPLLRLRLNDHELAFGGTEPIEGRRYVQAGDSVFLCTDRYYHLLTGEPRSFAATASSVADEPATHH